MCEIFRNYYGLDQLGEGLLLKKSCTTIYHSLGTRKLPRKNNSQKNVRFKFQMIVIRLPLKQLLGVGVWSRYGKKLELAAKMTNSDQAFFDDLINMDNQCIYNHIQKTDFKCYLQKWKVTSNFIFKLQFKVTSW